MIIVGVLTMRLAPTAAYNHPARQLTADDRAAGACTACGRQVIGAGRSLRHVDEVFAPTLTDPADAPAVDAARAIARTALDRLPPEDGGVDDRARAVVDALYAAGALRTRRSSWRAACRRRAA